VANKQVLSRQISPRSIMCSTQLLRTLAVAACAVLLVFPAYRAGIGQAGATATISGTVTDQSGSVLSGATVTVQNVDTNSTRTITTLENGNYVIAQLPPGRYRLSIDKPAFKTYQQNDIVLVIGQLAEINVQLQVGSEEQRVTVTAGAPAIQTEDSSVGSVIDSATIVNTPLNGRLSVMGLIALAPGVQGAGAQDQIPVFGVTPSIGTGSRNSYGGVGYTLDGAVNMEVTLERGEGEVPPLDGLAEFKVITSAVPAQFNQPSQVVIVSKSGTNQLHGMILEFNRVAATAAKSYFAGALPKPKYIRNEYGGNFSGPILIPKVYDGKDRSFFFFNYEGFRLSQAANVNSQMPTIQERAGNFAGIGTIVDPLTSTPFPNNQIPPARINQVDVALQNLLYPLPTTSGTGTNTFELVPYASTASRYAVRIDHKINDNNQLRGTFMRAFYGPNPSVAANGSGSSKSGGMSGIGEHNTNVILGWTHIFSPALLSDVTASYFHLPIYRTPQNYNVPFSSIIPGLGPELIEGAPQLTIKNITNVLEQGSKDLEQVTQLNTSVTKVLSSHTIKAGFSYLYDNHWNDGAVFPQRGTYTFTGQYSGVGYADFLLGYPATTGKPTPNNFITRNISSQYGLFVQDDWKATQRLTINAGIRYDLQWFRPSPYGNGALYVPSLQKDVVFASSYPSANATIPVVPAFLNLPVVLAPQAGLSTNLWDYLGQDTNNVAPRLGFAYQVMPKTVVRGAFGIFFNLLPASYLGAAFGNIPFQGSETFSQPAGPPTITMNAPFSATGAFAANPSVNAQHSTITPYTEGYNLAVEHELARGLGIRVGYVGQRNVKQNNASGPGNVTPDLNLPSLAPGPVQPRRFVQPWSTIPLFIDPIFHSTMNSAQVGVHKQYGSGFMLNAEYQYTRILGTENFQNPLTVGDSYGNIGGITPQVLEVSYSYPLPFGKGQLLFSDAGNLVNKIIAGWQLSGITSFQGGQPFSATYTSSLQGSVNSSFCAPPYCGRANRVPGVPLYPSHKSLAQWFNPAAFTAPPPYTYGTSGYNMLWGPRYQDWDMSLEKNTVWKERINLQLRMDAFNTFNHPNFAIPNATISNAANVGTVTAPAIGAENRTIEFAGKLSF
jgi:Carboxypeptidase regulatory-like domain/TonB dependent receptor-like, beta-barrel